MPRVIDSASGPNDFCRKHMPTEKKARIQFGNKGEGPDERGNCFEYNADHPSYEGEGYTCEKCGKPLGRLDD